MPGRASAAEIVAADQAVPRRAENDITAVVVQRVIIRRTVVLYAYLVNLDKSIRPRKKRDGKPRRRDRDGIKQNLNYVYCPRNWRWVFCIKNASNLLFVTHHTGGVSVRMEDVMVVTQPIL